MNVIIINTTTVYNIKITLSDKCMHFQIIIIILTIPLSVKNYPVLLKGVSAFKDRLLSGMFASP